MNQAATTRDRLLDAARRIFAQRGYDAASVREITRVASANLGAITYHFGSKQALYDAVLEAAFAPVAKRVGPGSAAGDEGRSGVRSRRLRPRSVRARVSAVAEIERIVGAVFEELSDQPDVQLLILQQVVHRKRLPAAAERTLGRVLGRISELVRVGQRAGEIRRGDPVLMAVSVMAQPAYFGLVRRFAPDRLSGGGGGARAPGELARHALRFIRAGLSPNVEADR